MAALIREEAFEWLDAPIRRLGGLDIPVPFSPPLEDAYRPNATKYHVSEGAGGVLAAPPRSHAPRGNARGRSSVPSRRAQHFIPHTERGNGAMKKGKRHEPHHEFRIRGRTDRDQHHQAALRQRARRR